ncbi:glutaminyl-peptide cyclotransferase [Novosphingobium umbonatum]|uniref:Glutaminyl-peptide cyclotransferase n=1 Tax=Novosphingobium umbonatum TaxID=1908524 RepID=A0A3S2USW3_9SPHN|nr:glutaminyl-peptide cyclotransferase [Novosphingobium umbonatum]RVU05438.1 glutaminyl-peptide cyclotransferase [Novosphingobium umbonatum]
MRSIALGLGVGLALLGAGITYAQSGRGILGKSGAAEPPVAAAQIVRRLPHDRRAYTEGLFIDHGQLFESTGMEGRSSLRRVDMASGKVLAQVNLPRPLFGEGIAPWHGQILMLTWRDGIGFRFSAKDFAPQGRFTYLGEGWGMAATPSGLVMSDGSDTLRFIDPATFRVTRTLTVTAGGIGVPMLNELEWVEGEILANVWMSERMARIDPETGRVKGWIDLSALHRETGAYGQDQVPNGIAYDAATRKLYVTGKEWPSLFEIKLPR